jgi:hypothetical protein
MAGEQAPGTWGFDRVPFIDEGTMCRAATPLPGTVREERRAIAAPFEIGSIDDLRKAITQFRASDHWRSLQPIVYAVVGPQSFGLGVVYGMGENIVGSLVGLAEIAKVFLLADLYDRAHQSAFTSAFGPVALFQRLLAEVGMRTFGSTLEQAHKEREALINELRYAVTHPGEVFDNVAADYSKKWSEFQELSSQPRLSSQFGAGRIFGEVLADVLALIGTGAAAVKAAAKIPKLARLARLRPARPMVEAPPTAPFTTPSRLRAPEESPALEAVTKTPKGQRPPPRNYMAQEVIDAHLAPFKKGLVKVLPETPQGAIGAPQGTYVLSKPYATQAIADAGGDVRKLERLLGLEKGYLGENPVLVEVDKPLGLRMPSGNEPGANMQWRAGGFTSGGVPEAVVDQIPAGSYSVKPVFPK